MRVKASCRYHGSRGRCGIISERRQQRLSILLDSTCEAFPQPLLLLLISTGAANVAVKRSLASVADMQEIGGGFGYDGDGGGGEAGSVLHNN